MSGYVSVAGEVIEILARIDRRVDTLKEHFRRDIPSVGSLRFWQWRQIGDFGIDAPPIEVILFRAFLQVAFDFGRSALMIVSDSEPYYCT